MMFLPHEGPRASKPWTEAFEIKSQIKPFFLLHCFYQVFCHSNESEHLAQGNWQEEELNVSLVFLSWGKISVAFVGGDVGHCDTWEE